MRRTYFQILLLNAFNYFGSNLHDANMWLDFATKLVSFLVALASLYGVFFTKNFENKKEQIKDILIETIKNVFSKK